MIFLLHFKISLLVKLNYFGVQQSTNKQCFGAQYTVCECRCLGEKKTTDVCAKSIYIFLPPRDNGRTHQNILTKNMLTAIYFIAERKKGKMPTFNFLYQGLKMLVSISGQLFYFFFFCHLRVNRGCSAPEWLTFKKQQSTHGSHKQLEIKDRRSHARTYGKLGAKT